jgi:hypothetical protein
MNPTQGQFPLNQTSSKFPFPIRYFRAVMQPMFFILTLAWLAEGQLSAGIFNANIIVNGDAEAGAGSANGDTLVAIPGWSATGGFNVNVFGTGSDTIPVGTPGPQNPGTNFFAGGPTNALSSASQTIDVSSGATMVDAGLVRAELTGWLGGYDGQDDNAVLTATYQSGTSATLGQLSIGPVLSADRTNLTSFLFRAATNAVPAGTRQIKLLLLMTRQAGSYNDGYADDLSLVLRDSPSLQITSATRSTVLSWSTNYPGFHLQTTTNLQTQWTLATNAISTNGTFYITTNQLGIHSQFFRLAWP